MKNIGSFYNKNGLLTNYGLSCGYIERKEINNKWIELYKEHNCFHVRSGNLNNRYDIWNTFDNLTGARKEYKTLLSKIKQNSIVIKIFYYETNLFIFS